jgi:hypothetical protein
MLEVLSIDTSFFKNTSEWKVHKRCKAHGKISRPYLIVPLKIVVIRNTNTLRVWYRYDW